MKAVFLQEEEQEEDDDESFSADDDDSGGSSEVLDFFQVFLNFFALRHKNPCPKLFYNSFEIFSVCFGLQEDSEDSDLSEYSEDDSEEISDEDLSSEGMDSDEAEVITNQS